MNTDTPLPSDHEIKMELERLLNDAVLFGRQHPKAQRDHAEAVALRERLRDITLKVTFLYQRAQRNDYHFWYEGQRQILRWVRLQYPQQDLAHQLDVWDAACRLMAERAFGEHSQAVRELDNLGPSRTMRERQGKAYRRPR